MHTFAILFGLISTAFGINAPSKRIPLYFEANAGQADPDVRFIARNGDLTALIKRNETVVLLPGADPIHIRLAGSRAAESVTGHEKTGAITSYFSGDDRSKWRTGIPHYSKVRATEVYPSIDVVYHANDGQLEYDFVIAPGADASRIELVYEGAKGVEIDENGDLKIATSGLPLLQRKPVAYQEIRGTRVEIAIRYVVKPSQRVAFKDR